MQFLNRVKILYQSRNFFTQAKSMQHYREDTSYVKLHKDYPDKG